MKDKKRSLILKVYLDADGQLKFKAPKGDLFNPKKDKLKLKDFASVTFASVTENPRYIMIHLPTCKRIKVPVWYVKGIIY